MQQKINKILMSVLPNLAAFYKIKQKITQNLLNSTKIN
jgi:hypothetical protein